jgi:hypothetical protein
MANTTVETGAAPAPLSLPARVIGIITSPTETYKSVVAHPKWLGMLVLTTLFAAAATGGFMMTEVGQNAWLDAAIRPGTPPEQVTAMERMAPMLAYFSIGGVLVSIPLMLLLVSGVLFAIFNAALGGNSTFKQLFAVTVHAGAIGMLAQAFTLPLNYARESMTSSSSLAVMLPMLETDSFVYRLAAWADLFVIWQLVVLAIGLGVLYRRKSTPILVGILVVYFGIALLVTAVTGGA